MGYEHGARRSTRGWERGASELLTGVRARGEADGHAKEIATYGAPQRLVEPALLHPRPRLGLIVVEIVEHDARATARASLDSHARAELLRRSAPKLQVETRPRSWSRRFDLVMGPRHTSSRRLMAGGERSVGSIMSIDPADLWVAADEDFQEWVLERAYADNPAQCPLSADEDDPTCSLIHFAQGSLEVVHDDLRRVLPPAQLKEAIDILRVVGIDDAFVVRRELVNYKKTCLNIQRCATQLDRDFHRRHQQLCRRGSPPSVLQGLGRRAHRHRRRANLRPLGPTHGAVRRAGSVQGGSRCHVRPTAVREDGVLRQPTSRKGDAGVPRGLAAIAEAPPEIRQVRRRHRREPTWAHDGRRGARGRW